MKYKPKHLNPKEIIVKEKERYYWKTASADCIAYPYIIHGYIYDMLCAYYLEEYGCKYYRTEQEAINALQNAVKMIKKGLESYEI